jgi:isoamylase
MVLNEGRPWPLGSTIEEDGVNFALFSEHASRVFLCLFDDDGARELERIELSSCTDDVWHIKVQGLKQGCVYGYRVDGPYDPQRGLRFNVNKLLLDPYARDTVGEFHWSDDTFGFDRSHIQADLVIDERDNALTALKSRVCDRASAADIESIQARKPQIPWANTVVYEAHVRGLTQLQLNIPTNEPEYA